MCIRDSLLVDARGQLGVVGPLGLDQALRLHLVADRDLHAGGELLLAEAIQEGLAAKAAGDEATATTKLGRAVQLAAETGNDEATSKLRKVVDIDDEREGTVRLKRAVDKADEMALDTASTKTTRIRKEPTA